MPLDYLSDENGDLLFQDGDLVVGESTLQHQEDLLMTGKGEWREDPTIGVGLLDWLDDDALGDLPSVIGEEFERDGMSVKNVTVTESGKLSTDASY